MIVDRDNGIDITLAESAHQIVGTLLHFGVGTLHGIQFDATRIATRIDRRHRASAQSDAIVITTNDYNLVALLRLFLQSIALGAVAHATSEHDNLIVTVFLAALLMFEGEHRTSDEGLSKLISEVGSTV